MHEITRHVLIPLPRVWGIDLSITNEVVLLWVAALVTFFILLPACRRKNLVAHGPFQNFFEALMDFIDKEVVVGSIGQKGRVWAPFLMSLFFFILFSNLLGLVPVPAFFKSATANINVTAGLALVVFMVSIGISIANQGILGFFKKFLPAGIPWWLTFLIVPIEFVTWLIRPASLAIRLFANMVAGHTVIFIFMGMALGAAYFVKPLPLAGAIIMSGFEIFAAFIQAFIFTMLSALYIREAMDEAH